MSRIRQAVKTAPPGPGEPFMKTPVMRKTVEVLMRKMPEKQEQRRREGTQR